MDPNSAVAWRILELGLRICEVPSPLIPLAIRWGEGVLLEMGHGGIQFRNQWLDSFESPIQ
jgi:hypothetical protein